MSAAEVIRAVRRSHMHVPSWIGRDVVIPLVVTRVALTAIGLAAFGLLPLEPSRVGWLSTGMPVLDIWSRWDGDWYSSIVERGYSFDEGGVSSIAFFPAYPALMRLVATFTTPDHAGRVIAGLVVSNVALVIGLIYLRLLVSDDAGDEVAGRAVRYVLIFPMSLFLSAVYGESLYLAFALGSLYHARHERWLAAAVLAGATALSRPFGVLIVIGLATELVLQNQAGSRRSWSVAVPIAATVSWLVALSIFAGRPTAFIEAVGGWGRHLVPPWETVHRWTAARYVPLGGGAESYADLALTAMIIVLVIGSWKLVRPSMAAWASTVLALLASTGTFVSVPRYCLSLYPAFVSLAEIGRRSWIDRGYLALATIGSAVFMTRFSLWSWVG